jgi:hypothetical protein
MVLAAAERFTFLYLKLNDKDMRKTLLTNPANIRHWLTSIAFVLVLSIPVKAMPATFVSTRDILNPLHTSRAPQTRDPRTIADYFLLIPERYISVPRTQRPALLRHMQVGATGSGFEIDVANGFMEFAGDGEFRHTVALFRRPDGSPLIGITYSGFRVDERRGGGEDVSELYFLRYDARTGIWRDVTRQMLPLPFNRNARYNLPRRGTTIEVYGEGDRKLYDLIWSQGRFRVRRAARESNEH